MLFQVVKSNSLDSVTIVTGGVTLFEALEASETLEKQGIYVRVIDLFTIKPIDQDLLLKSVRHTKGRVITVEDHYPEGNSF